METPISGFNGNNRWLSNFHPCKIFWGYEYGSVEAAYQAAKCSAEDSKERRKFVVMSPGEAKKAGKKVKLRPDWNEVKVKVMEYLLEQKFKVPELKEKLIATGNCEIIEENMWGDKFWGMVRVDGKLVGENNLGKLLMKIRERLMKRDFTHCGTPNYKT